jgi:hypothetical protein
MKRLAWFVVVLGLVAAAFVAGTRLATRETVFAAAGDGAHVAWASDRRCLTGRCETLWIGTSRGAATKVATLEPGARCEEIVWTRDGRRVAFLVNGTELRFYDASSLLPAGKITLIQQQAGPVDRMVRGVTFSENDRAITYDECPRGRSGWRAGFASVPK